MPLVYITRSWERHSPCSAGHRVGGPAPATSGADPALIRGRSSKKFISIMKRSLLDKLSSTKKTSLHIPLDLFEIGRGVKLMDEFKIEHEIEGK